MQQHYDAVELLAAATRARIDESALGAIVAALVDVDIDTLETACKRLAQTEEFMPSVAKIVAQCHVIESEQAREQRNEATNDQWSRVEPLPRARASQWMDHLKAVIQARRAGLRAPDPIEPLDSLEVVYRCRTCQDTGWEHWICSSGVQRSCGRDKARYADRIFYAKCRTPHTVAKRCACANH